VIVNPIGRRTRRATSLLVLVLGSVSIRCAAIRPPLTGPAAGGAPWIEVTSPHFVVDTDATRADAEQAVADFESIEALLSNVAFPRVAGAAARLPPQPTQVVIFSRKDEYEAFAPIALAAAYFQSRPYQESERRPRTVLRGVLDEKSRTIFQHELAHRHIHEALAAPAPWLNEGFAEYFSTARADGGSAFIAEPPAHFIRRETGRGVAARSFTLTSNMSSASVLLSLDAAQFYAGHDDNEARQAVGAHYAGSWALVHLMMNGPEPLRARFGRYLDALHDGMPNRAAWTSAFGDLPIDEIEHLLRSYVRQNYLARTEVAYRPPPRVTAQTVRQLSDAEVHVLWAKLYDWRGSHEAGAERELARAAATGPDDVEVRLARGQLRLHQRRFTDAATDLEAARARSPRDARVLTALVAARLSNGAPPVPGPELAALADQLEAVAATSPAFTAVARTRLRLGQARAALGAAKRAVEADPSSTFALETLATIVDELGDAAAAAVLEARAIDLTAEAPEQAAMRRRLAEYGRKADSKATAPPP
jgi:tetratricopeptide (TPR) repeat protein